MKKIKVAGLREAEDSLDRLYKKQGDEVLEVEVYVQNILAYKVTSNPAKEKPNGNVR